MKPVWLAAFAALAVSACAEDYYGGGGVAYYDGFYGPYHDGYWGPDGFFYFRGVREHRFLRDDAHHFRRDPGMGFHGVRPHAGFHGFRHGGGNPRGWGGDRDRH